MISMKERVHLSFILIRQQRGGDVERVEGGREGGR